MDLLGLHDFLGGLCELCVYKVLLRYTPRVDLEVVKICPELH